MVTRGVKLKRWIYRLDIYIYMLIDQIFPDAVWIVVLADVPVDTPVALGINRIA